MFKYKIVKVSDDVWIPMVRKGFSVFWKRLWRTRTDNTCKLLAKKDQVNPCTDWDQAATNIIIHMRLTEHGTIEKKAKREEELEKTRPPRV